MLFNVLKRIGWVQIFSQVILKVRLSDGGGEGDIRERKRENKKEREWGREIKRR
jgi:hypothetical protein